MSSEMHNICIHKEGTFTRKMSARCEKKHIGDTYMGKMFWGGHIYGQMLIMTGKREKLYNTRKC